MQVMFYFAFILVLSLVSCDVESSSNSSALETLKNITNDAKAKIATSLTEISKSNQSVVLELYHKISEGVIKHPHNLTEDIAEEEDLDWLKLDEESSTEDLGVDAYGCDRGFRKKLEDKCDDEYEKISMEAYDIEDTEAKTEALCCALEDFEKCNLRAFDKANCGRDKTAIRENMKAARLFITVVANVTCSRFRGLCPHYSSAVTEQASYVLMLVAILVSFTGLQIFKF